MASGYVHSKRSGHLTLWKCQAVIPILILLPLQIHKVPKLLKTSTGTNEMEIIQQMYKHNLSWVMVPENKINLKAKWKYPEEPALLVYQYSL